MDIAHRLKEIEGDVGRLSSVQKILLGTDGSVTQLLESVTGHPVSVRTREQVIVKADTCAAERLNIAPGDAVNHRVVELFDTATGEVLVYAKSQTPVARLAPEFRDDLMKADIPIGRIIERHHIEARREILSARVSPAQDDMSGIFSICRNEPLLSRQYQIIHGGEPLIFIEEKFPYNRFLDERRVIIQTPSRIHLTLLDMFSGSGTTGSTVVAVGTGVCVVSGTAVVTTRVSTGFISACVGLVHPAMSAQDTSTIHAAAITANLMHHPFFFSLFLICAPGPGSADAVSRRFMTVCTRTGTILHSAREKNA